MPFVRVIFNQWSKLYLGFDAEPEIRILKVIYCTVPKWETLTG
jgi:hypothetical protein